MILPADRAAFDAAFPDESAAESWLASVRWPDGPRCARCGSNELLRLPNRPEWWHCRACYWQTSLRSGTVLHGSRRPLRDWVYAMWACTKALSARQVMRDLGIRYETVLRMMHKIRASLAEKASWPIRGPHVHVGFGWFRPTRHASGDPRLFANLLVGVGGAINLEGSYPRDLRLDAVTEGPIAPEATAALLVAARVAPDAAPEVHLALPVWAPTGTNQLQIDLAYRQFKVWVGLRFRGVSRKYLGNYMAQFLYWFNRPHRTADLLDLVGRRASADPFEPIQFGTVPVLPAAST